MATNGQISTPLAWVVCMSPRCSWTMRRPITSAENGRCPRCGHPQLRAVGKVAAASETAPGRDEGPGLFGEGGGK